MSAATSTAKVETLPPRPKGKGKKRVAPLHGWQALNRAASDGLADIRATSGLADGLHELFALRLSEAEKELAERGKESSDDAGTVAYVRHLNHTRDLRTWVGVLAALKRRAEGAEISATQVAERVARVARKAGEA